MKRIKFGFVVILLIMISTGCGSFMVDPTPKKPLIPLDELKGKIVFSSDREEGYATKERIYMVDANGIGLKALSASHLTMDSGEAKVIRDMYPCWTPDGKKIIYLQETYIKPSQYKQSYWMMNIDGDDRKCLVNYYCDTIYSLGDMSLSPDGSTIVARLLSMRGPRPLLLIKDIYAETRYETIALGEYFGKPRWASDGKKVVFFGFSGRGIQANHDIFTIDNDGTNLQKLTSHPARDADPAFSPDGKQIAFISGRSGGDHVFIMDADGGNVRQVTSGRFHCNSPVWSPDGKLIAYCRSAISPAQGHEIWVTTVDGTMERSITTTVQVSDIRDGKKQGKYKKWSDDGSLDWR